MCWHVDVVLSLSQDAKPIESDTSLIKTIIYLKIIAIIIIISIIFKKITLLKYPVIVSTLNRDSINTVNYRQILYTVKGR
jgi:hypothetical protein